MLQHGLPTSTKVLKRWTEVRRAHTVNVGRLACLGWEVVKMKNAGIDMLPMVNVSKARTDLLYEVMNGENAGMNSREVSRFAKEQMVYWVTLEMQHLHYMIQGKEVSCLFMDSFADLTDQRFTHRENGWAFCSHYAGLDHSEDFDRSFSCDGLLEIDSMWSVYDRFFHFIRDEYPGIQITYIHFSPKHENRTKFKQRAAYLEKVMLDMGKKYDIINVLPPEEDIFQSEADNFPYHYSMETYARYVKAWAGAETLRP
jgi:hypothetical protein